MKRSGKWNTVSIFSRTSASTLRGNLLHLGATSTSIPGISGGPLRRKQKSMFVSLFSSTLSSWEDSNSTGVISN